MMPFDFVRGLSLYLWIMAASSSLVTFHKLTCSFCFGPSSAPAYLTSGRRRRFWSVSAPQTMADLVKTHAWRDGEEERFQALEQDAFINNPSNDLVSDGINAVANRLSKWVVAGLFGSVLLLRHDGAALWAVIGSWLGTNELSLFLSGLILALASYFIWLRVSQKLHTTGQVVVGAIFGSVYSTLWYITWNSLVLEAYASSFSVQVAVFAVAAASALGFTVYVLLNWFKDDR
ncbi:hypothetical protein HID58_075941 [Brassica napus]|uniref:Uncharacterized protein n=1 Tax=Brassica napus TaxID=3708 RepID=A0ABQ7YMC5_BRANA|nr:hypothetical protein HID58_075941 [Brassica napus]